MIPYAQISLCRSISCDVSVDAKRSTPQEVDSSRGKGARMAGGTAYCLPPSTAGCPTAAFPDPTVPAASLSSVHADEVLGSGSLAHVLSSAASYEGSKRECQQPLWHMFSRDYTRWRNNRHPTKNFLPPDIRPGRSCGLTIVTSLLG